MVSCIREGWISKLLPLVEPVLMAAVTALILLSQVIATAQDRSLAQVDCKFRHLTCILQSLPEEHRDKRRHIEGMAGADRQGGQPSADLAQRLDALLHELEPSACGNGTAAATHCLRSLGVLTQAAQAGAGPDWLCSRLAGLTGCWVQAVLQVADSLELQVVASVLGESPKLGRAQSFDSSCCWCEPGRSLVPPDAEHRLSRACWHLSPHSLCEPPPSSPRDLCPAAAESLSSFAALCCQRKASTATSQTPGAQQLFQDAKLGADGLRQLLLMPWTLTGAAAEDCTAAQQATQQQLTTAAKLHALVAEAAVCVLGRYPLGFAAVGSRDAPASALNNALQDPEPAVAAAAALLVPLALAQTAALSRQKAAAPVGSKLLQRGVSMLQGLLPMAKPAVDAAVARALGGLVDIQLAVEHPRSALAAAVICVAAQQSTANAPVAESLAAWAGCQSLPASTESTAQAALPVQALEGLARLQNADAPLSVQVCPWQHILKVLCDTKGGLLYSL